MNYYPGQNTSVIAITSHPAPDHDCFLFFFLSFFLFEWWVMTPDCSIPVGAVIDVSVSVIVLVS